MLEETYTEQAISCVKGAVLQNLRDKFASCNRSLDAFFASLNDGMYFGRVIKAGKEYELGYWKCTCRKVINGEISAPEHCECSRQSILFILAQLMPDTKFEVRILESVLRGGSCCRFRIVVLTE